MEFSVKKFDLLEELSLTQGVVERKTTIPILSNLLCEAKGNRLTITATDLELSIRTGCEAKVKKEGSGTIPAKKLLEPSFFTLASHPVRMLSSRSVAVIVRRLPFASQSRFDRIGMVVFRSTTPCVKESSSSRSNFFTLNSIACDPLVPSG